MTGPAPVERDTALSRTAVRPDAATVRATAIRRHCGAAAVGPPPGPPLGAAGRPAVRCRPGTRPDGAADPGLQRRRARRRPGPQPASRRRLDRRRDGAERGVWAGGRRRTDRRRPPSASGCSAAAWSRRWPSASWHRPAGWPANSSSSSWPASGPTRPCCSIPCLRKPAPTVSRAAMCPSPWPWVLHCTSWPAEPAWAKVTAVGAAAMALVVAWSRLYIGVHYPTDVAASFLAASAAVVMLAGLWNLVAPRLANRLPALAATRSPAL